MSILLKTATVLWDLTPLQSVRQVYFDLYCWFVRGKVQIAEIDGVRFKLEMSQTIDVAVYLRRFEVEIVRAIAKFAKPGYKIIDIGANTGMHALPFAARVGTTGKVYAFEPTDYAYARLEENIKLNPKLNVEAFKLALADKSVDSLAINYRSSWRTDGVVEAKQNFVAVRTLDEWMSEEKERSVDILKIDVDGNESPILNGAMKTLEKFKPLIFIEIGPWHFKSASDDPLTLLSNLGYRFWDAKTMHQTDRATLNRFFSCIAEETTANIIASASSDFPGQ